VVQGRKPYRMQRREAARLRANGLTLAEIGRRLGKSPQGAASLLHPLRETPVAICRRCGAAVVSRGALPDARPALCLSCLAECPEATFGDRLQAFRLAAGLTRKEFAKIANVLETSMGRYEQGRFRPRSAALFRVARALGVPPEALEPGGPVPPMRAPLPRYGGLLSDTHGTNRCNSVAVGLPLASPRQ
jgi:transcriptional regulator with XRE-family HTH domain